VNRPGLRRPLRPPDAQARVFTDSGARYVASNRAAWSRRSFHQATQSAVARWTAAALCQGRVAMDELGLVEAVDGLGQRVVVALAARADRADGADLGKPAGVPNREVLDAPVGVVDEACERRTRRDQRASSRASRGRGSPRGSVATRQPTIRRLKASTMNAA
jgi:hypothetical protein